MTPLDRLSEFPWWPFSQWQTAKLIRDGTLGCVRVGRRVFVTEALLRDFVERHTVKALT